MALNDKEKQTLNGLLEKALNTGEKLTAKEVKELQGLFTKLTTEKEEKKDHSESLEEVAFRAVKLALIDKAIEKNKEKVREKEKAEFNSLPVQEKHEHIEKKLEELTQGAMAKTFKAQEEAEKKENFEEFYEEYTKRHGKTL